MAQPRSPIRVAIVGAGGIAAGGHLPALRKQGDRVSVVALVDLDRPRAEALASQWSIPSVHGTIQSALARTHPDLVVVCTPPAAHRDAVVSSLRAGAWVWCEKPPALSLAEYDEIASHEGDPAGPYAAYVFQQRFGSAAATLRGQIARGELGTPLVAICHTLWYRDDAYYQVPWRGRWETEGGGPTMGHGIHQLDLALSLLGEWTEVRATLGTLQRTVETEDVSMAMVRFESGALMSVVTSVLSPRETSYLRFDFAEGTVEVTHLYGYDNSNWTWTPAAHVRDGARVASWAPEENLPGSHETQLADLLDAFESGRRPAASGADGRRALELIAGLYQSAQAGRPVTRREITPGNPYYHSMRGATC